MAAIKRALFTGLVLAILLTGQALAVEVPEELERALPEGTEQAAGAASLEEGLGTLWDSVVREGGDMVRAGVQDAVKLLLVLVLCGVGEGALLAVRPKENMPYVTLAGALAIVVLAAGDLEGLMGLGVDTITELLLNNLFN